MSVSPEDKSSAKVRNRRVHMANERTFLAWIRTSIGIMASGFVVEKFALFVKQLSYFLGKEITPPSQGYSSVFGIFLVGLGALINGRTLQNRNAKCENRLASEKRHLQCTIIHIFVELRRTEYI